MATSKKAPAKRNAKKSTTHKSKPQGRVDNRIFVMVTTFAILSLVFLAFILLRVS